MATKHGRGTYGGSCYDLGRGWYAEKNPDGNWVAFQTDDEDRGYTTAKTEPFKSLKLLRAHVSALTQ